MVPNWGRVQALGTQDTRLHVATLTQDRRAVGQAAGSMQDKIDSEEASRAKDSGVASRTGWPSVPATGGDAMSGPGLSPSSPSAGPGGQG